jgi:hypothetical protein
MQIDPCIYRVSRFSEAPDEWFEVEIAANHDGGGRTRTREIFDPSSFSGVVRRQTIGHIFLRNGSTLLFIQNTGFGLLLCCHIEVVPAQTELVGKPLPDGFTGVLSFGVLFGNRFKRLEVVQGEPRARGPRGLAPSSVGDGRFRSPRSS